MPDFPVGVVTSTVSMNAPDFGMGVVAGRWQVDAETSVIWQQTKQLLLNAKITKAAAGGRASIKLPCTDQSGFVGKLTPASSEFAIRNFAYHFRFTATRDGSTYDRWVYLPVAQSPAVSLFSLPDLRGFPNVTPTGGSVPGTYVESPAGSGLFRWVS